MNDLSQRIRDDYEAGESLALLANAYGLATTTIRRHITDAGGTIRPAHAPRLKNKGKICWFTIEPEVEERLTQWCEQNGPNRSLVINMAISCLLTTIGYLEFWQRGREQ